jgi:LPXTG-motif cell wall-anchored protein
MGHIVRVLATAGALAALSVPAVATARHDRGDRDDDHEGRRAVSVPELDPTAAGAIAAVLAGGGLLLARRRRSKD